MVRASRRDPAGPQHWTLPKSFTPLGLAEDGGERDGSYSKDWRINAKVGFTPNDTDEYSLSFTRQSGEKGAPLGVDFFLPNGKWNCPTSMMNPQCGAGASAPYQANNFWTWPYWNVQGGYWLSNTRFGETGYVKTRLYYNEYDNALYAWDDNTYSSQSASGRFRSFYADTGAGGSVEAGASLLPDTTTRVAFHARRDRHSEYNFTGPPIPARPWQWPSRYSATKSATGRRRCSRSGR